MTDPNMQPTDNDSPKTPRQALKRLRDSDNDTEGKIIREQIGLLHQMEVKDRIELLFRFHITMQYQLQLVFQHLAAINQKLTELDAPRQAEPSGPAAPDAAS